MLVGTYHRGLLHLVYEISGRKISRRLTKTKQYGGIRIPENGIQSFFFFFFFPFLLKKKKTFLGKGHNNFNSQNIIR